MHPWDRKPQTVREMLATNDIPATDKRVRFIGLDKYEAEGGTIRRDLFAEGEAGTYIADPAKLTRLVSEKLHSLAETVQAEGWKWVGVQQETDHRAISRHKRVHAPELPLSEEAKAEVEALEGQRDAVVNQVEEQGADEEDEEAQTGYEQIDAIDRRIQAIRRNRRAAYSDQVKASCGVVVSIEHTGEPAFVYGLLRKEDEIEIRKPEAMADDFPRTAPGSEPEQELSAYSAPLLEVLTQHKTAAIAAALFQ